MAKLLLVDDDTQILESTKRILQLEGHTVLTANCGQSALEILRESTVDLVLSDIRMPKMDGLEFLKILRSVFFTKPILLMTAYGRVEDAFWALKMGVVNFLSKPFSRQHLIKAVDEALLTGKSSEKAVLEKSSALSWIGSSTQSDWIRSLVKKVAPTEASVLILGESGTGKELLAHWIHNLSPRREKSFVAINCAALPDSLVEAELFGFERGSFTGATQSKKGFFELAHQGTLFLDEIGDMSLNAQARLLRAIQEKEIRRIGSSSPIQVDVRILAATHQDLEQKSKEGNFREDLLYRLEVVKVEIPPLRERQKDISEMAVHLLSEIADLNQKKGLEVAPEVFAIFQTYHWPGNVRELRNVIERAVVLSSGTRVEVGDLPEHIVNFVYSSHKGRKWVQNLEKNGGAQDSWSQGDWVPTKVGMSLKDAEDLLIEKTLLAAKGDKEVAAGLLGINARTISRWIDRKESARSEIVSHTQETSGP